MHLARRIFRVLQRRKIGAQRIGGMSDDRSIVNEEIYRFRKTQLFLDVRSELEQWGKKRFWLVVGLGVVITTIGVKVIVLEGLHVLIRSDISELRAPVTEMVKETQEAAINAKNASDEAVEAVKRLNEKIKELEELQAGVVKSAVFQIITSPDVEQQFLEGKIDIVKERSESRAPAEPIGPGL